MYTNPHRETKVQDTDDNKAKKLGISNSGRLDLKEMYVNADRLVVN